MPSASRLTRQSSRIGASSSITSTRVIGAGAPTRSRAIILAARGGPRGQLEREARALALVRVDPDPPAHRVDEPLRDEEAEPGAAACEPPASAR